MEMEQKSGNEVGMLQQQHDEILCNDPFYDAICAGSIKHLDALIQRDVDSLKLDENISCAYENLKLKNVPLTPEMEIFVENELIKLRFFSNTRNYNFKSDVNTTLKRLKLVLENITLLISDHTDLSEKVDEKFLFILSFIAQNLHILKQQLRASYSRLPWEEMEFLLVSFVVSYKKKGKDILFCRAALNKSKILIYLKSFAKLLEDEKVLIPRLKGSDLPKCMREKIVKEIIGLEPQFEEMYRDYEQIRDVNSLLKINDYLGLALSVDCKEREGQLIITRVLQVIGEFLKNTLESPKLSNVTSELILFCLPNNTRDVIIDLRNSLSHVHSLSRRIEIEENTDEDFFSGVQKDIKTINCVIDRILWNKKTKLVRTLLEKISKSKSLEEVKDVINILECIDFKNMKEGTISMGNENKLQKLVEELNDSIHDQTEYEKKLFSKINKHFVKTDKTKVELDYSFGLSALESFYIHYQNHCQMNGGMFPMMLFYANKALEGIGLQIEPKVFDEIATLSLRICKSVALRKDNDDSLSRLLHEIAITVQSETGDLSWIEELREKINVKGTLRNRPMRNSIETEEKFKDLLEQKLSQLRNILSSNEVMQECCTKDKKLLAVVEMLVLDIMSILSERHLENNLLFLDENAPLLTGKCLRNHLAHDNVLLDALLSDPSNAVMFNAQKLASEDLLQTSKKMGKLIRDDPIKLRNKFNQNLKTIINQEKLFAAFKEGNMEKVKCCLDQGADVHGRTIQQETTLHFAAKSPSLKAVKFLLSRGLDVNAKDAGGRNALHIAAAHGWRNTVEYLIKEKGMDYKVQEMKRQTPLHMAAKNGHKSVVDFLIQYDSGTTMRDMGELSPLHYAVMNSHVGVINRLLEKQTLNDFLGYQPPLHVAAEAGKPEIVNLLIKKGANVNERDHHKGLPLHVAAQNGHFGVVKVLIMNGSHINSVAVDGSSPLMCAADYNHEKVADFLLMHGADVNIVDEDQMNTALHLAARKGFDSIITTLLKNNADANAINVHGITPLHLAARNGFVKTVALLLKHGVNVNVSTTEDSSPTPLHCAAEMGHDEIAELLIKAGAKVESKSFRNAAPLHVAAFHGKTSIADLLIRNGANVDSRNVNGTSPLHTAAMNGCVDMIELLIQNNADVNARSEIGMTPLLEAIGNGCVRAVDLLIKNGASVNVANSLNITPLHLAALMGQKEIIQILLQENALVNAVSPGDLTPLDMAVQAGHKEVVAVLLANRADVSPEVVESAVKCNNKDLLEALIAKGGIVHVKGKQLLFTAVSMGHRDIVEGLLKHKTDDVNLKDETGMTALHFASYQGHRGIVKALLENGAHVNALNNDNDTPINYAVRAGHSEIVKLLIKKGASINVGKDGKGSFLLAVAHNQLPIVKLLLTDNESLIDINAKCESWTALHLAVQENNMQMVEYLLSKGSDMHARNDIGAKPIHFAARHGSVEMVQFFLNKGMSLEESTGANQTLVHYATIENKSEMLKFLISEGAEINVQDINGSTPLHIAANLGHKTSVKVLLENGAKYDIADKAGLTPLRMSLDKNVTSILATTGKLFKAVKQNDLPQIKILIDSGAAVNATNTDGGTPLHYAAWKGNEQVVNMLLYNKANVNASGKGGFRPLHYASKYSRLNIVKALLSRGAIFNSVSDKGTTPRDIAVEQEVIRLLKIVKEAFEDVQKGKTKVINDLNRLDMTLIKSVMGAHNENGRTLIAAAVNCNFPKLEELKQVKQVDNVKVSKAIEATKQLLILGEYDLAYDSFKQLYQQRKDILGPDNPATLEIEIYLADVHYKKGSFLKSLKMFEGIYEKQKRALGHVDDNNNDLLKTGGMVGLNLHRLGRNDEAYVILQDVYEKQSKLLGPDHKDTMSTENHLGMVLIARGDTDAALKIYQKQYEYWKQTMGKNNAVTISVRNNMAIVLHQQGRHEESLKVYREVYEMKKKVLGVNHCETIRTAHNMATVLVSQDKFNEALKSLQEVLASQRKAMGNNHPETLHTQHTIADIFLKQGKYTEALKAFQDVLSKYIPVVGPNHPSVLDAQRKILIINCRSKVMDGGNPNDDLVSLFKALNK